MAGKPVSSTSVSASSSERGEPSRRQFEPPMALHGFGELLAVLGELNRPDVGTNELHAVLVEHAAFGEFERDVERRLAAHGGDERVGLLRLDDARDPVGRQRLDVGRVGDVRVRHDRGGIRVHEDDSKSLLAERPAGLRSGVVELAGLADHDRSGAYEKNRGDVVAAWHRARKLFGRTADRSPRRRGPRRWVEDRGYRMRSEISRRTQTGVGRPSRRAGEKSRARAARTAAASKARSPERPGLRSPRPFRRSARGARWRLRCRRRVPRRGSPGAGSSRAPPRHRCPTRGGAPRQRRRMRAPIRGVRPTRRRLRPGPARCWRSSRAGPPPASPGARRPAPPRGWSRGARPRPARSNPAARPPARPSQSNPAVRPPARPSRSNPAARPPARPLRSNPAARRSRPPSRRRPARAGASRAGWGGSTTRLPERPASPAGSVPRGALP